MDAKDAQSRLADTLASMFRKRKITDYEIDATNQSKKHCEEKIITNVENF